MAFLKFNVDYDDLPDELMLEIGEIAVEEDLKIWTFVDRYGNLPINIDSNGIFPEKMNVKTIDIYALAEYELEHVNGEVYSRAQYDENKETLKKNIQSFEKLRRKVDKAIRILKDGLSAMQPIK